MKMKKGITQCEVGGTAASNAIVLLVVLAATSGLQRWGGRVAIGQCTHRFQNISSRKQT